MKKGISLIVLVITIIVMIIIAGAIIISLSQTNVIEQANDATARSNKAEAKSLVAIIYASKVNAATTEGGWVPATASALELDINTALNDQFPGAGYTVSVAEDLSITYTGNLAD